MRIQAQIGTEGDRAPAIADLPAGQVDRSQKRIVDLKRFVWLVGAQRVVVEGRDQKGRRTQGRVTGDQRQIAARREWRFLGRGHPEGDGGEEEDQHQGREYPHGSCSLTEGHGNGRKRMRQDNLTLIIAYFGF